MFMQELAAVFVNNLLPILLTAGAGFALGKFLAVDSRALGRVVFYVFSPLLVFDLMAKSQLNLRQSLTTVGFAVAVIVSLGAASFLLGRLLRLEREDLLAVMITVSFGNTGNYGLPLVKFAFGADALAAASLFYVVTAVLFHTAGVILASLGRTDFKSAALGLFKLPIVYGVSLALLVRAFGLSIPLPLSRTIEIGAGGAIPVMLILLGLELTRVQVSRDWRPLVLATSVKLLLGPLLGLSYAEVFGLQGAARQGGALEAAMPAAVVNTVVAAEYNLKPALVTAIVFFSTALSPLTLTPLLAYLAR